MTGHTGGRSAARLLCNYPMQIWYDNFMASAQLYGYAKFLHRMNLPPAQNRFWQTFIYLVTSCGCGTVCRIFAYTGMLDARYL